MTVRCADCGFLAVRHKETRELCEVERRPDNGAIFVPPEHYEPGLRCSRALRDFGKPEITSQGAGTTTINWRVVYDRADEDIECDGFRKHIPGLTPKEHREMLSEEFQRDFAARQYAAMLAREDRRDAEVRGRHRWDIIAFGLLVAASTLIGSMISAGWFGRPW